MKRDFILNRIIKVMLLVLSMTVGQNAWAESTWEVTNENGSSNTFIIKRSETGYEQTVHLRTISLSAYAGQHFTAVDMDYTFLATEDTKTVTVSESTPSGAYAYQTADSRKYGFEVTDRGGFRLAYAERSKTWGTSVTGSGVFSEKDVTIHSGEVTVTDGGYAQSSNPYTINSSSYYNAGTQAYLSFLNAQLRMTLNFQAKEKSDGYQYVQILVNNTTDCDTGAGDGNPGTINLSRYMAGFTIGGKGVDTYYNYSFPVTTVGNDVGATKPWTGINNTVADLEKQKFNTSCRATDGKLIIPTNFTTLVVRLNASGSDNDDWYAKNIKANIIAVDATAPTKSAVSVNPGRHAKGNTVYVSVAFSEIVTVTGTPTLSTTSDNHWGSLSYVAGSGTNVLTFSTTIPQDATGNLNVTGYSGTITDLAGNSPSSGSVTASSLCSLDDDLAYTLSDFQQEDGNYLITCHDDLRGLAGYVNSGNNCSGLTFRQVADIAFAHTTNWNNSSSTENNFTAIGDNDYVFQGTYDGDGHTISGIRIYKGGDKKSDRHQGLFGMVGSGGTVKRVTLADARITGRDETGGIAGQTFSCTIEDCTVGADVCIHAVKSNTYYHGGIVGYNQECPVNRCISRATLTVADASGCHDFGGIVGRNSHTITDCIAEGVVIPDVKGRGAIVGYKRYGTLTRNYYRGCTVAGVANATGVGQGTSESSTETSDPAGARALYALSLPANTVIDRTPSATLPGSSNMTYADGATIGGTEYYVSGATIPLRYSGTVPEGFIVTYSATAGSISGNVLTMADADVTVSVTCAPDYATHWHADADHDGTTAARAYIITTTTGLNLLATLVNGYGYSDFSGTYFQLGNDIEYTATTDWNDATSTENNYTAIGGWRSGTTYNQFKGSFDGDGHTISGIRIYKPESSTANGYQGLFGYVGTGGSIHDVNLADARITGQLSVAGIAGLSYGTVQNCTVAANVLIVSKHTGSHYHGGIVGMNYGPVSGCTSAVTLTAAYTISDDYAAVVGWNDNGGTIENCRALGATIPVMQDYYGVIVGYNRSGTLTANHYLGCTVGTTANAVGVGAGKSGGAPTDVDGARSVHNLTLPDGVTATGESVEISSITYYAAATDVTLSCTGTAPAGYVEPCYYTVDGTNISGNTFTMPASDATVALLWTTDYETGHAGTEADPYIISDYPQLELLASRVNSVNYYSKNKHFKLGNDIVCFDGENNHTPIGVHVTNKHFSGTFDGDGHTVSGICISSSTGYQGLFGYLSGATVKNVTLAGSTIIGRDEVGGIAGYSFKGSFENCRVLGDVTIKANASSAYYHGGIVGNIFGGGTVNGCYSAATVTRDDNSNCKHYGGIVGKTNGTVSDCIALGARVTGSETSSSGAIVGTNDGGTLARNYYYGCSVEHFGNNVGTGSGDVSENDGAVQANAILSESETVPTDLSGTVAFRREFTGGKASTICLPFAMTTISGGKVYEFVDVTYDATDGWVATMSDATPGGNNVTTTEANKPYLFLPDATGAVVFGGAADYDVSDGLATTSGDWTFTGTYTNLTYGTEPMTGHIYGFASKSKTVDGHDVEAGQFVHAKEGASVPPMRCYLTYKNGAQRAPMRASALGATGTDTDVPSRITVRLVSASGTVTAVGTLDTVTGEMDINTWYDMNGRLLETEPTAPGLYIHNGKTIMIKK